MKTAKTEWITQGFTQEALEWAKQTGETLKEGKVSTAHLRKFFGSLRRIEMDLKGSDANRHLVKILILRPRLAYAAARASSSGENKADKNIMESYVKQIDTLLQAVIAESNSEDSLKQRFQNFMHIQEAIIAYHKSAGGK